MVQETMNYVQDLLQVGLQPTASKISNLIGHEVTIVPQHVASTGRSALHRYTHSHVVVEGTLQGEKTSTLLWMFENKDVMALLGNVFGEQEEGIDDFSISAFHEIIHPALHGFHQSIASFTGKALDQHRAETKPFQTPEYYSAHLEENVYVASLRLTTGNHEGTIDVIFDEKWLSLLQNQHKVEATDNQMVVEVGVKEIVVPTFNVKQQPTQNADKKQNLDLIMNVPLHVSIELGKTKRKIKEIMDFSEGYVLELEKQTGAPVDIVVNGHLIARGDVVVIDENFAVRVTEIVNMTGLVHNEH